MNQRTTLDASSSVTADTDKTHIELIENIKLDMEKSVRYLTLVIILAIVGAYGLGIV